MRDRSVKVGIGVIGLLLALSGAGGVVVGGVSAQAGWWLLVVGIVMAWFSLVRSRSRRGS